MATLIRIGCLLLTPEQLKRALDSDLTINQTLEMIRRDREKEEEERDNGKAAEGKEGHHE